MEIFSFISPFIAAFLASGLTYYFAIRAKKHEIIVQERLLAFKAIHRVLLRFRKYYWARIGDRDFSEFALGTDSLENDDKLSPLEQLHLLDSVLADNEIFLPKKSRELFSDLNRKLSMLCSSEMYVASQSDDLATIEAMESQLPQFIGALDAIDKCIEELYKNLKMPR